jgi:DNA-binding protein Fis
MNSRNPGKGADETGKGKIPSSVEDMIEKKLEDIATILCAEIYGKSRLHEDVMTTVERSLFRIALRRSNNVKSAAAAYLGINRNSFQNKLVKFGINCQKVSTDVEK